GRAIGAHRYDPFAAGRFAVGVQTIQALDPARGRRFPTMIWSPTGVASADQPLVVFSHSSGGNRRSATFLCSHLASHGYVVAAMDHSEVVTPKLSRRDGETDTERAARVEAVILSRVPDVRFLLDRLLTPGTPVADIELDSARVGLVGHSFGGWTVLATLEVDPRPRAVVAMGAGGSAHPRPGILPVTLTFAWDGDVPVLYLAAENDVPIP